MVSDELFGWLGGPAELRFDAQRMPIVLEFAHIECAEILEEVGKRHPKHALYRPHSQCKGKEKHSGTVARADAKRLAEVGGQLGRIEAKVTRPLAAAPTKMQTRQKAMISNGLRIAQLDEALAAFYAHVQHGVCLPMCQRQRTRRAQTWFFIRPTCSYNVSSAGEPPHDAPIRKREPRNESICALQFVFNCQNQQKQQPTRRSPDRRPYPRPVR